MLTLYIRRGGKIYLINNKDGTFWLFTTLNGQFIKSMLDSSKIINAYYQGIHEIQLI